VQSPYPFWQQLLIILLLPPIVSLVFGVLARGRGDNTEKTINRRRTAIWAMMFAGWIVGFGEIIFVHFHGVPRLR
jgi:hypothetical protein